jgi:hypothetical protein
MAEEVEYQPKPKVLNSNLNIAKKETGEREREKGRERKTEKGNMEATVSKTNNQVCQEAPNPQYIPFCLLECHLQCSDLKFKLFRLSRHWNFKSLHCK